MCDREGVRDQLEISWTTRTLSHLELTGGDDAYIVLHWVFCESRGYKIPQRQHGQRDVAMLRILLSALLLGIIPDVDTLLEVFHSSRNEPSGDSRIAVAASSRKKRMRPGRTLKSSAELISSPPGHHSVPEKSKDSENLSMMASKKRKGVVEIFEVQAIEERRKVRAKHETRSCQEVIVRDVNDSSRVSPHFEQTPCPV